MIKIKRNLGLYNVVPAKYYRPHEDDIRLLTFYDVELHILFRLYDDFYIYYDECSDIHDIPDYEDVQFVNFYCSDLDYSDCCYRFVFADYLYRIYEDSVCKEEI